MASGKIKKLTNQLHKELKKEYPEKHWCHCNIFNAFWCLVNWIEGV